MKHRDWFQRRLVRALLSTGVAALLCGSLTGCYGFYPEMPPCTFTRLSFSRDALSGAVVLSVGLQSRTNQTISSVDLAFTLYSPGTDKSATLLPVTTRVSEPIPPDAAVTLCVELTTVPFWWSAPEIYVDQLHFKSCTFAGGSTWVDAYALFVYPYPLRLQQ